MPEPVSIELARAQLRLDDQDDDSVIEQYISAARVKIENHTGVLLAARPVVERFDRFHSCGRLELRHRPVFAGDVTQVAYVDTSGSAAELVGFRVLESDLEGIISPAVVMPALGSYWPLTYYTTDAVTVFYVAGFADPGDVPAPFKQAILVLVTAMYENRGSLPPEALETAQSIVSEYPLSVIS
jgi:uncharacterized phiE125 gp8 family phage protein